MHIALAQLNPTVGDIPGNIAKIKEAHAAAAKEGALLVVMPELTITGYPPEDLVLRPEFRKRAMEAAEELAEVTAGTAPSLLVGGLWEEKELDQTKLYNAAFLMEGGKISHVFRKHALPNYDVFDEKRLFALGPPPKAVAWHGLRLGVLICEDLWDEETVRHAAAQGLNLLCVLNASPYTQIKREMRFENAKRAVVLTNCPLIYVNQIGGQDELVFDGRSFVLTHEGELAAQMAAWEEHLVITPWTQTTKGWRYAADLTSVAEDENNLLYSACVIGLRDYVEKNGFKGVLLGLSGGIDSALAAVMAVDALGTERVHPYMLPSKYTSAESKDDAAALATTLGIKLGEIAIEPAVEAFTGMLKESFAGQAADITEENLQSRIRGVSLMAVSNKFGWMLITTGNKSEMAVGYATLYGDMCGGYNPLKDLYKTKVYALSKWRNTHKPSIAKGPEGAIIPERILTKAPTAELKPNQKDQDSLPPYDHLDWILERLIEGQQSVEKICEELPEGLKAEEVERVAKLLFGAEYKRRQAPPGPKVTALAFGRDRRYPLTNRYRSGA